MALEAFKHRHLVRKTAERLKQQFEQISGDPNVGRLLALVNGDGLMVCETSRSWSRFSDSQLVEQIRFTIEDIARTFAYRFTNWPVRSRHSRTPPCSRKLFRRTLQAISNRLRENLPACTGGEVPFLQQQNYPISALADRPPPDSQPSASSNKGAPVMPCSTLATPAMAAIAKTIALLKRPPKSDSQKVEHDPPRCALHRALHGAPKRS